MAGSTRIKGRQLTLTLGSPAKDYMCDTTSVILDNEEADEGVTTFCDAAEAGGARQEFLTVAGIQSTDTDSLWSYLWDHAGDEVPFVYAPWGNATPSVAQPHYTGVCILGPRPTLGGAAGRTETYTFEARWDLVGKAEKVTTAGVAAKTTSGS